MTKLDENEIISIFQSYLRPEKKSGFGFDDVSILPISKKKLMVLKCDMLVQGTDIPNSMKPWQISRKSIVSCVSDLACKGVNPYTAMISLGIPTGYSKSKIRGLAKGFKISSDEFGVRILAADTNKACELIIDCSMVGLISVPRIGRSKEPKNSIIPQRSGAIEGDSVIVSGFFGYSAAGLAILQRKATARGEFVKKSVRSVLLPIPRQDFGSTLARFFSSSIDSSDGLAKSLYHLAKSSGVDIVVDNIPAAPGIAKFAEDNKLSARKLIFYGGEEYEIIATIPRANVAQFRNVAQRSNLAPIKIGYVLKGKGRVFIKSGQKLTLLAEKGYVHKF